MNTTPQLIDAIQERTDELQRERNASNSLLEQARRDLQAAPDAIDEARRALVETLVPSIDTAVLDAASQRIRLPKIAASALRDRMLDETRRIDAERVRIERDDRFRGGAVRLRRVVLLLHDRLDQRLPLPLDPALPARPACWRRRRRRRR